AAPRQAPPGGARRRGGGIVTAALLPDRLHGPRQLGHGGDVAAEHTAPDQRPRGGGDVPPRRHHAQRQAVERLVLLGLLMLSGWAGLTLARPARAAGGGYLRGGARRD